MMNWFLALVAWGIVGGFFWSTWSVIRDAATLTKRLHTIPCANCQFYTRSSYLKCPIHPSNALTEEAIGCVDYSAGASWVNQSMG